MSAKGIQTHAWPLRLAHWTMAIAILVMIGSGWRIYNAEPILPFRFPLALTLGGDVEAALARHGDPGVATAIAWHFAGMWLLGRITRLPDAPRFLPASTAAGRPTATAARTAARSAARGAVPSTPVAVPGGKGSWWG